MPSLVTRIRKAVRFVQNTAATHELIAAVAGKRFEIKAMALISGSDTTASNIHLHAGVSGVGTNYFFSNTIPYLDGTSAAVVKSIVLPEIGSPWFSMAAGEALNITLSGASQWGGYIIYDEVDE